MSPSLLLMLRDMKNILCIVPLPPPHHGMANVSKHVVDVIGREYNVSVINLNKKNLKQGIVYFERIYQIVTIFRDVVRKRKNADLIYFTQSQSIIGNIKDLLILLALGNRPVVLHLHGGGIKQTVFEKSRFLKNLNRLICKKVKNCIVLGESHIALYDGVIPRNKVFVVRNYCEKVLLIDKEMIEKKFKSRKTLKILYLSNLLPGKGYLELAQALVWLEKHMSDVSFKAVFAGEFENINLKKEFFEIVQHHDSIEYVGVLRGIEKTKVLHDSHLFCLPSYYPYGEGQPLSILEAYASGCVVMTTHHGGIPDIFINEFNGFEIEKQSVKSIVDSLQKIWLNWDDNKRIAFQNRTLAETEYSEKRFDSEIMNIFF